MPFVEPEGSLGVAGRDIPLLDPILSQMNPIHILTHYLFKLRTVFKEILTNSME
jgi:hypothetical protein